MEQGPFCARHAAGDDDPPPTNRGQTPATGITRNAFMPMASLTGHERLKVFTAPGKNS
jgi:hypothetical protein